MAWQKTRLDIFIPEDRRHALIKGETLPVRTRGAVLFVDISGFTKLTSFLSTELGPQRGAEELTRQLDPIYTELVDAVHTFRGSVIVISGDGITCWFDQDDGRRATTAAFRMQRSMARYETILLPTGQQISLGVKITLSVGPAQRFLVGDPKVQLIEALAGRELDEVGSAQHLLDKGEIAVSARLLKEIEAEVIVRSIRETMEGASFAVIETKAELAKPDPWPEITQLDNEVARKWVFASIYQRIRDEEMEFLTELRQVVPMFIKFTGLDYDEDESAGEKLDRFVQQVQAVLLRYEGYLCQVTIGDKGSNVFIAFGAPIAHEDDVSRALAAALELRKKIAELGFIQPVQIGLAYGQLWAGAHGGQDARIYSVIGEEVNLAARLMSHAKPGQILVSPHLLDTTSSYSFAPLSPIQLKGIPKPMTPFLLLGKARALSVPVQQNHLFGRTSEQAILMQKLIDLTGGAPEPEGMILIEGEAGIGKSLLLTDFMEKADQLGVQNFTGYGDPVERSTPYFGIRPVFEALLGISDEEDVSTNQRKALSAIEGNPFLKDRVPLLSEVIPLRLPDNDLTGQMVGEARATSLREFLLEVLRFRLMQENGNRPAVIVLDDAQWLDPATWNLVGYISRELPAIQIAIGIRPLEAEEMGAQMEEDYRRLRKDSRTTFIQLHALHEEDITGLVARKLGVESLPDPVHAFIQARAQGNPFFSEEIAYALRDAGLIKLEHGRAVLQPGAEQLDRVDFPQTIQGVITSRIDRLSPAHQLTLKVASVIGRVFLINMLANVHPSRVNPSTLADYLTVLTQLGITELETPTPELTYLFKHVITQEVVYTLLTFAQRKQLHCAIAEWYELNYREDPAPYYPRLAHHWLKGEVVGKAIHYLDQAGEQALESYANEEMIRFISIAIALADKGLDQTGEEKSGFAERLRRARWERMLGTARFRLGQLPEAHAHLKRTLELLGKPMPDSPFWLSLNLLKELLQQISYRLFPKQLKSPLSDEQRAMQQELASVDLEGVFYYSQNNLLLAWGMLRRLNLAERLGDPALMAQGYSNMQLIVGLANLRGAYQTYRKLKEDSLEKADRTSVRIYALLREAVVHFIRCDWQEATDDFDAGLQLAERLGDNRQWAELMAAFATSLHLQAEFEREHSLWVDQYQKFSRSESVQALAWSLYGQGHSLLMFGQVDEAIRLIEASIAIPMKNADDKILDTSRYGALSLAYFRKGDYGKSLENILQHQRLSPSTPPLSSTVQEYGGMFEAVIGLLKKTETGGYSPSHTELAQIKQAFRRIPHIARALRASPVNKASTYLYEGIYNEMSGNLRRARHSWRKCIELAEAFQQPYEQGRAHYEMGLNVKNPARAGHFEEAYRIFDKLHTPYELELVERALEQATSASGD